MTEETSIETSSEETLTTSDSSAETPTTFQVDASSETFDADVDTSDETEELIQNIRPNMTVFFKGEDTYEKLYRKTETAIEPMTDQAFLKLLSQEEDSFEKALYHRARTYSREEERQQESLKQVDDADTLSTDYSDNEGRVIRQGSPQVKKSPDGARKITADDGGFREFAKITGNIRRVPLPNSGFSIDISSPTKADIHDFIQAIDSDTEEYGRIFGVHFYMFHDLIIKQTAWRFIRSTVVGATLHNWDKRNVLEEAVSLHDFNTLLWGIAHLMYPQGYHGFTYVCMNDDCRHVESITADLRKLQKTDFTRLPSPCIHDLNIKGRKIMDDEKLSTYHENLNFRKEIRFQQYGIRLRVPSMRRYFDIGDNYNSEIQKAYGDDVREIESLIGARMNRTLTPWVHEVVTYGPDDDDSEVVYAYTEDTTVIAKIMDAIETDDLDNTVWTQIIDFINSTQLTHVCYPVFQCPSCGHTPETETGFLTVDPLRAFFTMSGKRLINR